MKIKQRVVKVVETEVELEEGKIYYTEGGVPVKLVLVVDGMGFLVNYPMPKDYMDTWSYADGKIVHFQKEEVAGKYSPRLYNQKANHRFVTTLYNEKMQLIANFSKYKHISYSLHIYD